MGEQAHLIARGAFSLLTSLTGALPLVVITENAVDVHYLGNPELSPLT